MQLTQRHNRSGSACIIRGWGQQKKPSQRVKHINWRGTVRWSGSASACFLTTGTKGWDPGRHCLLSAAPWKAPEVNINTAPSIHLQTTSFLFGNLHKIMNVELFFSFGVCSFFAQWKKYYSNDNNSLEMKKTTTLKMLHRIHWTSLSARSDIMRLNERDERCLPYFLFSTLKIKTHWPSGSRTSQQPFLTDNPVKNDNCLIRSLHIYRSVMHYKKAMILKPQTEGGDWWVKTLSTLLSWKAGKV